jgi:hypothetical protein
VKPILDAIASSTPKEAFERDLPAIGFTIDFSGTALQVEKFPTEDCYLRLTRPPQKSLEFRIDGYRSSNQNKKELVKQIRNRFNSHQHHPLILEKNMLVRIDKVDRIAKRFFTGSRLKRKEWVSAMVPSPSGGPYGLLISMGYYIGDKDTRNQPDVTKHPVHKHLISTFSLEE